ncbi:hypothetical protein N473_07000 [Pseudoalteromonas luteoviolacea CPMOR-1]|uniref:Uncharacterized protein n=1 Tax=Pseudoalteromonas luteoviolacea CPMOR-1 TaxID=1365248 RepID=A0A161YCI4_9GAMM|nr:hypothetical protein [Pseudoalteromonas luteoviolacea]KZN57616.1 hypothetical protein N473_07000 [Pseudoalteromonas luteoviolacea CPMOR-1]
MGSNWDWSRQQGRRKRIEAELAAHKLGLQFDKGAIPIHSLDGTMQSQFEKGWRSVSETDVRLKLDNNQTYMNVRQHLHEYFGERDL